MKNSSRTGSIVLWVGAGLIGIAALIFLVLYLRPGESDPSTPVYWPTTGWRSTIPEERGMDSGNLAEGLQAVQRKAIAIHSLMIVRNGSTVVDATYYPYDGKTVHNIGSVTKSLVTTLLGIAVDQGKLKLDQSILSFFPERSIANRNALKERITIRHLASMSSGLSCIGLEGGEKTVQEMEASPDWVQFALDLKVVDNPGTRFEYCGINMHLLAAILQKATGMTALEFANQTLFEPLGIQGAAWPSDPQGINQGSGNMRLLPADMAKIGFLWLNKGVWEGKQIVSRQWVEESVKVQIKTGMKDNYGYGWWVGNGAAGNEFYADGRGGQRISVFPDLNIILVTTGGGFNIDDVVPYLTPALVDMQKPLPANPGGVSALNSVLAGLPEPPAPEPVASLSDTAKGVSSKVFAFEANSLQLKTMHLEFNTSAEARIQFGFMDGFQSSLAKIGLDGVYRMTTGVGLDRAFRTSLEIDDLPVGQRGSWVDAQTFRLEYATITNRHTYFLQMKFEGDQVVIEATDPSDQTSLTLKGSVQN